MSQILVLTRGYGPFQGQIVSRLQENGHTVHVYDVNGQWLTHGVGVPLWMRGYRLKRSAMASGYIMDYVRRKRIDRVVSLGLAAGAFAADNVSMPFLPVLARGDLDFSAARTEMAQDFETLGAATDRLLLDDEWEMDKAAAKGSRAHHLRTPLLLEEEVPCLASRGAVHVGVIHPDGMDPERLELHLSALRDLLGAEAEVTPVTAESLFHRRDLVRKRRFAPTVRDRLASFSQLVLLGSSPHHAAVIAAVRPHWAQTVVEDTIGSGGLAKEVGIVMVGRGVRVAELSARIPTGDVPDLEPMSHPRPLPPGDDVLTTWDEMRAAVHPSGYEELAVLRETGPVDVFFSVAPLQDRTDGARPQRIRNMAEALDRPVPALRIFANRALFDRRASALRSLLAAGRPPGILYGENSTSPMPEAALIDDVAALVREFGARGGKSAWFVRDLHWLDDVEGYLDDEDTQARFIELGRRELEAVGGAVDVLLAPSVASGAGFDQLLGRHGLERRDWVPAPPGVTVTNVSDGSSRPRHRQGTTLLYAGGLNNVYSMDSYLECVRALGPDFLLDFVVRAAEAERLEADLEKHGIPVDGRVRLITAELDHYRPRTSRCVGVILLDSEYAKFSFPYKTVSMIEHGFPILCFEDMGIADFVRQNGLGVACERSVRGVLAGIEDLATHGAPGLEAAPRTQSWDSRLADLRSRLEGL